MKILPISLAAALLATGVALSAGAQDPTNDVDARVAALEAELALERQANEETRALLEEALDYLHRQADSAGEMLVTLDVSEAEGFTAGINFRSREILLAGWRDTLHGMQQAVPGKKKAAETRQPPRR